MSSKFEINQIGIINTPFDTKEACPIQSKFSAGRSGRVTLLPEYLQGLETIELFSHLILFYIFDRAGEMKLSRPTFLDDEPHGVFASRHPCRPNSIGISTVELERVDGNILHVRGIDVLDGTPLIDIKPYVPIFDHFEDASNGWVEGVSAREKPPNRE